jgi:septal ring-binding cell division protein DamX
MKKLLGLLLVAIVSLAGGIKLGQDPPQALTQLGTALGIELGAASPAPSVADTPATDAAKLIPLTDLNLLPGDPPGTIYTLSINETMNKSSLDADIQKLTAALYESTVVETADAHNNTWYVLTVGEYASIEEAQSAGAVLYSSLGISTVTKKLPPPPAP